MLTCFWSPKGGTGTTTAACAFAAHHRRTVRPGLVVDLGGDADAVYGVSPPLGIGDWLAADDAGGLESLLRLELPVGDGLRLLAAGTDGDVRSDRADALAVMLATSPRHVVVDVGVLGAGRATGSSALAEQLVAAADRSVVVIRSCYLALRRLPALPRPTHVLLVLEAGRALRPADVTAQLGPVPLTVVPWDPAVARAVDAGLLAARPPRALRRAVDEIA